MGVALNANALITKAELELISGLILDEDTANTLINFASDRIKLFLGRELKETTYTNEVYSGNGRQRLYLRNYPIILVTSVVEWDTYNDVLFYTLVANQDYLIYGDRGYIYLRGGWTQGNLNYKISYKAGYATIPYDVKVACIMVAVDIYDRKGLTGMKGESIGSYSYTKEDMQGGIIGEFGLSSEVIGILSKYKAVNIGEE
jgi:hypothetical protein